MKPDSESPAAPSARAADAKRDAQRQRARAESLGKPGTFSGLMNLYEGNFKRIERLLVDLSLPIDSAVSRSESDRPLHLRVIERTRYTATLHLTYKFEAQAEGEPPREDPDIRVRIYFDARLAEVIESTTHRVSFLGDIDPLRGGWTERQHARNLLLHKWLDYLLAHGHGFVLAGRPRFTPFDAA